MLRPDAAAQKQPEIDLRALVEQCVARYPTDGAHAVDELCAQFPQHAPALRRRVAILERTGLLGGDDTGRRYPERLGDFRLLELIGEGGMGAVFKAHQLSLGRQVALKVIRAEHAYSPRSRERFRREIEAIAAMRSPGIVQVYTVGDEGGVPFYAMELVDGINLADLVLELRRAPPERLNGADARAALRRVTRRSDSASTATDADDLFAGTYVQTCCRLMLRVARTLAYAHERGVLHRDVKPSNVMLDRQGRVLLLDFGLARAVETEADAFTRTGAVVGSLAYMAPEQMLGARDIDARVDVYGLGVTLYELLTHRAAFRGDSQEDLRAKVLTGAVPPPTQLNPAIPRDAETICLKAMAQERSQRYASAQALADDLQRLLELRPIEARRAGAFYRVRRWVQRHPAKATALAAGVLILIGGPFALAVQERLARGEIQAALARAERYQKGYEKALATAMQGMERTTMRLAHDEQLASGRLDGLRRELLEGAAVFWETMAAVDDPHPGVREALFMSRNVLASVRRELGDLAGARAVLDAAIAQLEATRAAVTGDEGARLDQQLAKTLSDQADVMMAQREYAAAYAAWNRSAAIAEARVATAPNPAAARRHVLRCRLHSAQALAQNSDASGAVATCREVLAEIEKDPEPDADLVLRARTLLAAVLMHRGDMAEALPALELTVELRAQRRRDKSGDVANLRDLKSAHHNLGYVHQQLGDIEAARRHLEEAAGIARQLAEAFPDRIDNKLTLVSSLMVLGNVYLRRNDRELAEQTCREGVAVAEALARAHPDVADVVASLAEVRSALAQVLMEDEARREEAALLLHESAAALEALARAPEANVEAHGHHGTTQGLYASVLAQLGQIEESFAAEDRAWEALGKALRLEPGSTMVRGNLARIAAAGVSRWLRHDAADRVRVLLQRAAAMPELERDLWALLETMPRHQLESVRKLRAAAQDPPPRAQR